MLVLHTAADSREAVSMYTMLCWSYIQLPIQEKLWACIPYLCASMHMYLQAWEVSKACSQRLLCKRARGPSMGSSVWNVQCSISGTLKGKTLIDFGDTLACWWHFSTLARIKAGWDYCWTGWWMIIATSTPGTRCPACSKIPGTQRGS